MKTRILAVIGVLVAGLAFWGSDTSLIVRGSMRGSSETPRPSAAREPSETPRATRTKTATRTATEVVDLLVQLRCT